MAMTGGRSSTKKANPSKSQLPSRAETSVTSLTRRTMITTGLAKETDAHDFWQNSMMSK